MRTCLTCRWEPHWKCCRGFCRWPLWRRNGKDVIDKSPLVELARGPYDKIYIVHSGQVLQPCKEWRPAMKKLAKTRSKGVNDMKHKPMTKEEAQAHIYKAYGGIYKGRPYIEDQCAAEVWPDDWGPFQCSHKNGHGPGGLYCKQHAKILFGDAK